MALDRIARCWRSLVEDQIGDPALQIRASERIKRRAVALARIAELERRAAFRGVSDHPKNAAHPAKRAMRETILQEEGARAAELAFLYDVKEEYVRQIRREAGVEPDTGKVET